MKIYPGYHDDPDYSDGIEARVKAYYAAGGKFENHVTEYPPTLPKWYSEWNEITVAQMVELIEATKGNRLKLEIYFTSKATIEHNAETLKKYPPGSYAINDPEWNKKCPRTPDIGLLFENGKFGWNFAQPGEPEKLGYYGLGPGKIPEPWELYEINLVEELKHAPVEKYGEIIQKYVDADK
jgi:hypothetical protein